MRVCARLDAVSENLKATQIRLPRISTHGDLRCPGVEVRRRGPPRGFAGNGNTPELRRERHLHRTGCADPVSRRRPPKPDTDDRPYRREATLSLVTRRDSK